MVKSVELLQEPNKFVTFDNFDLILTSWLVCCSCLLIVEKSFSLAFFFFFSCEIKDCLRVSSNNSLLDVLFVKYSDLDIWPMFRLFLNLLFGHNFCFGLVLSVNDLK